MVETLFPAGLSAPAPAQPARTFRYPSGRFPGPPAVNVEVPLDWMPLAPDVYLRLETRIDLAVVGPSETDTIRPSLWVSITRTAPTDHPQRLLVETVQSSTPPSVAPAGRFHQATGTGRNCELGGHLSHACSYDDHHAGRPITRLRLTAYVHDQSMAHIVSVVGSASKSDRRAIGQMANMIQSLQIAQPAGP